MSGEQTGGDGSADRIEVYVPDDVDPTAAEVEDLLMALADHLGLRTPLVVRLPIAA